MLFDVMLILPALAAGFIILLSHVVLGRQVLKRGIIFLDLAIAQMAALGVVLASQLHIGLHIHDHDSHWAMQQVIATFSAVTAAALLAWLEKHIAKELEAMIGCLFILASTGVILLVSHDPHGGETIKDMLVGQILWLTWQDLFIPGCILLSIAAGLWLKPALLESKWFYVCFAVAITQSVQLIGVYLVFSSLVLPALAFSKFALSRAVNVWAIVFALIGYVCGLIGSLWFDLPAGPLIVWSLACLALCMKLYMQTKPSTEALPH